MKMSESKKNGGEGWDGKEDGRKESMRCDVYGGGFNPVVYSVCVHAHVCVGDYVRHAWMRTDTQQSQKKGWAILFLALFTMKSKQRVMNEWRRREKEGGGLGRIIDLAACLRPSSYSSQGQQERSERRDKRTLPFFSFSGVSRGVFVVDHVPKKRAAIMDGCLLCSLVHSFTQSITELTVALALIVAVVIVVVAAVAVAVAVAFAVVG
jgi:hypothetical protein